MVITSSSLRGSPRLFMVIINSSFVIRPSLSLSNTLKLWAMSSSTLLPCLQGYIQICHSKYMSNFLSAFIIVCKVSCLVIMAMNSLKSMPPFIFSSFSQFSIMAFNSSSEGRKPCFRRTCNSKLWCLLILLTSCKQGWMRIILMTVFWIFYQNQGGGKTIKTSINRLEIKLFEKGLK